MGRAQRRCAEGQEDEARRRIAAALRPKDEPENRA